MHQPLQALRTPSEFNAPNSVNIENTMLEAARNFAAGNLSSAEQLYLSVLQIDPSNSDAYHNLAVLRWQQGQFEDSVNFFKSAVRLGPLSQRYWLSFVTSLYSTKQLTKAAIYLAAAKFFGFTSQEFKELGKLLSTDNASQDSRQTDRPVPVEQLEALTWLFNAGEYEALLSTSLKISENYIDSPDLFNLMGLGFFSTGKYPDAVAMYGLALKLQPNKLELHNNLGLALQKQLNFESAASSFEKALQIDENNALALMNYGVTLESLGRTSEAIAAIEKSHRLESSASKKVKLAEMALRHEQNASEALRLLEPALRENPTHTTALAYKTIALRGVGKFSDAAALINFEEFVSCFNMQDYTDRDITKMNQQLAAAVEDDPRIEREHDEAGWAIRGGSAVRDLFQSEDPIISEFEALLKEMIARKISQLDPKNQHPFTSYISERFRINCWANVLSEGNFQANHIHNRGWMSGVYYVEIPTFEKTSDAKDTSTPEGWIEFNRAGYGLPEFGGNQDIRAIKPQPGMLIIFPSYVWHGTVSHRGPKKRISISFDVEPA